MDRAIYDNEVRNVNTIDTGDTVRGAAKKFRCK